MNCANDALNRPLMLAFAVSMLLITTGLKAAETKVVINHSALYFKPVLSDRLEMNLEIGQGFRTGDMDWSIAGTNGPNILSELTYQDIRFVELAGLAGIYIKEGRFKGFSLTGRLRRCAADDGTVQDSDYRGDNRTREYNRALSSAEDSTSYALDLELGYRLEIINNLHVTPSFGYHTSEQNMHMTQGNTIIGTSPGSPPGTLGPYEGLDWT